MGFTAQQTNDIVMKAIAGVLSILLIIIGFFLTSFINEAKDAHKRVQENSEAIEQVRGENKGLENILLRIEADQKVIQDDIKEILKNHDN